MGEHAIYDTIGRTYARYRRPDPRIAAAIGRALGDAQTVLDVGAGTGSYAPSGRSVIAVEPSRTMIAQRPEGAAPVAQAVADSHRRRSTRRLRSSPCTTGATCGRGWPISAAWYEGRS
jgi:hypothetical protein